MDAAALTAVVLLGLGLVFLVAELLFGSDGSLSILGFVFWIAAAVFAWEGFAHPLGLQLWAYVLAVIVGIPVAVGAMLTVLPNSPAGRKLFTTPEPEDVRPVSEEENLWRESLIGELGRSLTLMNPGGLVPIEGERQHAESEGLPIEPGQTVEVIAVRSNRFIVRLFQGTTPLAEDKT
jgi:membrane-bound serine protease (ClpP class)